MYSKRLLTLMGFMLLSLFSTVAIAQGSGMEQQVPPLPIDPEVRIGQLSNGLTYIIRHNEQPKERATFYIAQRVGSMQEEDNQAGLAHFLEHMAFNGTRHFPDKNLISYLENIGVKFGSNLNAYTAFDETRYTIMDVPTMRSTVVDSCLLILRDWSDGISLEEEEIDNERGVITEEWRSRDSGNLRLMTEYLRRSFPEGAKYGNRMPIGNMDVIKNFTYQELRDYYQKWYRPDLQGIIVVGDVDVDYVENKIEELFGDLPKPVNAAERVYEEVPDHEPLSIVLTDPESTGTNVYINYSMDAPSKEVKASAVGLMLNYIQSAMGHMINARFQEILQKPNAPFIYASGSYGPYIIAMTEDALSFSASAHEGKVDEALNALVAEIKRIKEYGFTPSEYDRARIQILNSYDEALKSKDNVKNTSYADEYGDYFTVGGYIPGIEIENALMNQVAPSVTVDVINQVFNEMVTEGNLSISIMAQEKEGLTYPTEEEFMAAYLKAFEQPVEPYEDAVSDEDLIPEEELPTPGFILSEETDLMYGATLWTLSNGAKVYLLPTDYKKNDIRLFGISPGGFAIYGDKESTVNIRALDYATIGGVSKFDEIALRKVLTGKTASASTSINRTTETVSGISSDKDIETMLQLVYLNMTDVRKDEDAFTAIMERRKASIKAAQANPLYVVQNDSLPELIYPGIELQRPLTVEEYDEIDYDRLLEIQADRFADASDFTFFLVGSFDMLEVQPLIERYIGGLPAQHRQDPFLTDSEDRLNPESRTSHFSLPMDNPIALVVNFLVHDGERSLKETLLMHYLSENLSQYYHEAIREEEGGTYGVAVSGDVSRFPAGETSIMIFFQTNPEDAQRLNDRVKNDLKQLAENGLNEEFFNKTKQNIEKKYKENQTENKYWLNQLNNYFFYNEDLHSDYLQTSQEISLEDVNNYLRKLLSDHRFLEMIASGVKPESK
ncbi:MAG: insulinase family protein [Porphyromonas sp.]|nr:insulinase family protein [Porphyromonas sp.]